MKTRVDNEPPHITGFKPGVTGRKSADHEALYSELTPHFADVSVPLGFQRAQQDTREMDFDQAKRILSALERQMVEYVLIGGMAMAAQGLVRATRDIDIVVSATAGNVERLKTALRGLFDDPEIDSIRADELAGDYPAIQYVPPVGEFWIDILARLGEAFQYTTIESEEFVMEGVRVRVATPRALYQMKKDTVRPQDRLDAEVLRERFGLTEE